MIAPSLYADLIARGVRVSIAPTPKREEAQELPPLRLQIRAPEGALNDALRSAIAAHRDELLQFVFELEEATAILIVMQGNRIEEAAHLARGCVRGGSATPAGELWLRDYARRTPEITAFQRLHRQRFGCDADIVSVQGKGIERDVTTPAR